MFVKLYNIRKLTTWALLVLFSVGMNVWEFVERNKNGEPTFSSLLLNTVDDEGNLTVVLSLL